MNLRPMNPTADDSQRLRELILHIARKSECDEKFGRTKLNKLLFYSDFSFYLGHARSITREEYTKLQYGPVPSRVTTAMEHLISAGDLAIQKRDYLGMPQERPIALRDPDLSNFTGDEISFVDYVVEHFRGMNGTAISDVSHGFAGWKLADMYETIPYDSTLLERPTAVTEQDEREIASIDQDEVRALLASV